MASLTAANFTAMLKELYPESMFRNLWYKNAPAYALIPKDTSAEGELVKIPLQYGNPQGRSATFSNARTNQTAGKYAGFEVDYVSDYSTAQVDGMTIAKSKSNRGSFVRALKSEMDGALNQLRRSAHHALFRNSGGALGQVLSTTTTILTLSRPEDVVFFEVGQEIVSDTTDGTSGAVNTGSATITAISRGRDTATLTSDSNWTAQMTTLAADDYLFVQGDFGAKYTGFEAWVPATAPTSTAFHGVDRSVDTTRLGGVRYDGSALSLEEALIDGAEIVAENGGQPDVYVVHMRRFADLAKALGSRREYGYRESEDGTFSFRTLKLNAGAGQIDVVADLNCQYNIGWCLQSDTWKMYSIGSMPQMLDDDGLPYLRVNDADGVELRAVYRANLTCSAPGWNGRIVLPV